jgi:hypothetical protein
VPSAKRNRASDEDEALAPAGEGHHHVAPVRRWEEDQLAGKDSRAEHDRVRPLARKLGDGVAAVAAVEGVGVVAEPALEIVVAGASGEQVVARAAGSGRIEADIVEDCAVAVGRAGAPEAEHIVAFDSGDEQAERLHRRAAEREARDQCPVPQNVETAAGDAGIIGRVELQVEQLAGLAPADGLADLHVRVGAGAVQVEPAPAVGGGHAGEAAIDRFEDARIGLGPARHRGGRDSPGLLGIGGREDVEAAVDEQAGADVSAAVAGE